MERRGLANNIAILMVFTVLLKGMGFINRMVIAYYYGTTSFTDVYYNASGFVDSLALILLASLSVGVINVYLKNKNTSGNNRFISNLLISICGIMIIIGVVLLLCSDLISHILAPAYKKEELSKLAIMLKTMSITLPFQGAISVFSSILQAEKKFTPVKLTGAITSGISILCVILFNTTLGVNALVVSYITGIVFNAAFLFGCSKRLFRFEPSGLFRDVDIKTLLILIGPLLIGTAGHEINLIIDKSIASQLVEGSISALSYSCVLYLFIENVINNSIVVAIFPDLTERVHNSTKEEIADMAKKTTAFAEYLLFPIVIICAFCATDITKIVYMRGNFNSNSLQLTSEALTGYVFGLPFMALRDIVTRIYYAYSDTKTPVKYNLIAVCSNIVLDYLLSKIWGVMGITVATSFSCALAAFLLLINVRKHNCFVADSKLNKMVFSMIMFSLVDFVVLKLAFGRTAGIGRIIVTAAISFLLEIVFLELVKPLYYKEIKQTVLQKISLRKRK